MTVARWLPLTPLVALACAAAGVGAACTTGTTPVCDDAGSCLISEPPDGTVVGDGAGPGPEGGQEAGPEPSQEAAPQEAAPQEGAADGGDAAPDGSGG